MAGLKPGDTIRFRSVESKGYRTVVVSGVWGHVNQMGLVHATLYNETVPVPDYFDAVVNESGGVDEPETVDTKREEGVQGLVLRESEVLLTMPPLVAIRIGQWLMNTGKQAMSQMVQGLVVTENDAPAPASEEVAGD